MTKKAITILPFLFIAVGVISAILGLISSNTFTSGIFPIGIGIILFFVNKKFSIDTSKGLKILLGIIGVLSFLFLFLVYGHIRKGDSLGIKFFIYLLLTIGLIILMVRLLRMYLLHYLKNKKK